MDLNKPVFQWLWLITLAFIWGSSFILIKKGLQSYTPVQVAAYRMFFASVVLLPISLKHFKKINRKNFIFILEVALIGNAIPAYFFALGQTHITSSLAGILNSVTPIATLVIGVVIFRTSFRWINGIGLLMGLIGTIGLLLVANNRVEGDIVYALLLVLASVMYAFNLNVIKHKLQDMGGIALTALAFLFILPISGLFLLFSGFEATHNIALSNDALFAIFLLAMFSSAIAVVGFNILIKYTSAIFASSVTYIIPVFAIMWGIVDGEPIFPGQIIWFIVIILGIYLVNKKSVNNVS